MILRIRLWRMRRRWARYWRRQRDINLVAFWDDVVAGREGHWRGQC